jgi:hypothetical protein
MLKDNDSPDIYLIDLDSIDFKEKSYCTTT